MSSERSVLMVVLLATAMSNLDQSIVGVALPTLRHVFDAEIALVQWIILAYQFAIVATLLIAGRLADRLGARRVFLAGLALFTLASGLCGLALSTWQLVAFRGLQGVGAAMLLATGQVLLTDAYPVGRRGTAMGHMHMAVAVGLTTGPSLGGLLIAVASWRAIFLVNVPIGLFALWFAVGRLPRVADRPAAGPRLDRSLVDLVDMGPLLAGLLTTFLVFVALAANMFLIPFALQPLMELSPAQAGLVMIAVPLTILVVAPLSGRLTDRIGPRWPASVGIGLVAVAILLMAQLRSGSAVSSAVLILVLYGAGAGFFQAPNNAAVMTAAPRGARGLVSGALALARSLGQIGGVALASTIWSLRQEVYAARAGDMDPLAGALRDSFLVLAVVALAAVVVSLLRGAVCAQPPEVGHDGTIPRSGPCGRVPP